MSPNLPSAEALEKQLRLVEKKLERSERHRAEIESQYDRELHLYRRLHADLEAAHRQAEIEAALERVRSRTMAMRSSDELAEVSRLLNREVIGLGTKTWGCAFNIYGEDHSTEWFGTEVGPMPTYPTPREDCFLRYYEKGQEGETLYVEAFDGDDCAAHYEYMLTLPVLGDLLASIRAAGHDFPSSQIDHVAYFKYGYLLFITLEPAPEAYDVFRRFAKVFEQTYTRFLDLQQAEARSHQAEQEASLDRVRAEIASMRTSSDLQRITPLVWRELTALGVPFFRCGVFIMNEAEQVMETYLTTPDGASLAALRLPYGSAPTTEAAVAHWRRHEAYTTVWDRTQFEDWVRLISERGLIHDPDAYGATPPERLALHFAPFAQGMLYVGSAAPLDEAAVASVQALADAFAVAFARYEDFQRLEASNREIEAAMAELRATQRQLVQQEKLASLGALTAGIAHEIKNPLNFVNNFAQLSEELVSEIKTEHAEKPELRVSEVEDLLDDLSSNAARIREHGQRADSIVKNMLAHSRGTSGAKEPVDVNALLDEYTNLAFHGMRAQRPRFTCTVERAFDAALPPVYVIPQDVSRVFLNLLSNAFYAGDRRRETAPEGYVPTVRVATRFTGDAVEATVWDNGGGIPDAVRAKVFEPFFTTKPTGEGTGLGLSLSHDIIAAHGGSLDLTTEPGAWTQFTVRLPIGAPSQPAATAASSRV